MRIQGKFLNSTLGRRLFFLFCVCSLVPLLLMGALAFTQVKAELKAQAERSLQQSTKATGMAIYERMILLSSEMERIAAMLENSGPSQVQLWDEIEDMFVTLVYYRGPGRTAELLPSKRSRPIPIDYAAISNDPDNISVFIRPGDPVSRLYLTLPVVKGRFDRGFLVGEINSSFLWKIGSSNILPPQTEILVLDQDRNVVLSSLAHTDTPVSHMPENRENGRSRQFQWTQDGTQYLARCWNIFMPSRFHSDSWRVVLAQSKDHIYGSVSIFQQIFPLILGLSFLIVVFLSMVNIRLILDPLDKLKAGIQRIAVHDFQSPIHVESHDEFAEVAGAFNHMSTQLGRQFRAIHAMSEVDRAILSSLEPEDIINRLLSGLQALLSCCAVAVSRADPDSPGEAVCYIRWFGGTQAGSRERIFLDAEDIARRLNGRQFMHLHRGDGVSRSIDPFAGRVEQWMVLPVFVQDQLAATLNLGYSAETAQFDEDLRHAARMADQMAVALANSKLVRDLDHLNQGALTALARTVDAKSPWTAGHSERVSAMAQELARVMGLEQSKIDNLYRAALLHDIGKVGISSAILDKPGKLTDEEYAVIKKHPRMGVRILEPIKVYHEVIPIVLQHHERYDGKGYPDGASGRDIVLEARIMAVADVYDALISDRPYRPGWEFEKVVDFIRENSASHFDPEVVRAFESLLASGAVPPIMATAATVQTNKNNAVM